ncbi:MAG: lamin tail domain-containing protein, partial [Candidatus Veblenbacteria bacterium]|nr:lamin tail domain-containing protein [Candidatus Veblenbacteria bacterium]
MAVPLAAHASLQLSELLPDPAGDDNAEWVELVNNAEDDVSTAGWKLVINNRTTLLPARTIAAHQFMVFTKTETKFTLTNSGATVSLLDPASTATSQLSYGQAPTGQSYALNNGTWQWTNKPT